MYDEVILDRAVQIAAKNGWDGDIERSGYAPLVYNKDFARALWGEEEPEKVGSTNWHPSTTEGVKDTNIWSMHYFGPAWKYHLQQMVISPDAVKYISDNMP